MGTLSPIGGIVAAGLLVGFIVWFFWTAAGPPPTDAKRHKWARRTRWGWW